jgi:FAD binding domain in molybdopterin dehydrogenase
MIAKEKHAHSVLFFVSHRKGIRRGRLGYAVLVMENTEISQVTVIVNGEPCVLNGASGQIRTIATVGGNLPQRTRCPYFRDVTMPCNKREAGSGCQAAEPGAETGNMAILGHSPFCVATHPSDMALTRFGLREEESTWPCQTASAGHGAARAADGGSGASSRG